MISMDKKYRYRKGGAAKILTTEASRPYSVVSMSENGDITRHTSNGMYYSDGTENVSDLIEVVPLWRGELLVNPEGTKSLPWPIDPTDEPYYQAAGWRRVTAVEERSES